MAIKPISEMQETERFIDLTGPEGNGFSLIAQARRFCKDLGMAEEETAAITADMQSSNYEHLLEVFDEHFGKYCTLYR